MSSPSEEERRAFLAGFAVSDECFSAEGQYHYEWAEVFDAYKRGELEAWLEEHRWTRALAIIRTGNVEAGRDA